MDNRTTVTIVGGNLKDLKGDATTVISIFDGNKESPTFIGPNDVPIVFPTGRSSSCSPPRSSSSILSEAQRLATPTRQQPLTETNALKTQKLLEDRKRQLRRESQRKMLTSSRKTQSCRNLIPRNESRGSFYSSGSSHSVKSSPNVASNLFDELVESGVDHEEATRRQMLYSKLKQTVGYMHDDDDDDDDDDGFY
jgi:hypothetical protein